MMNLAVAYYRKFETFFNRKAWSFSGNLFKEVGNFSKVGECASASFWQAMPMLPELS